MAYRRLAWHRSWAIIGFGCFVSVWSISGLVEGYYALDLPDDVLAWAGILFANYVVVRIIMRGVRGSHSKRQLRVDVPAGMLQLETGELVPLDQVGEVTIKKKKGGQRGVWWSQLHAAGIPNQVLYESTFDEDTQKRLVALQEVVLESKVRRVLERPEIGEAYRAAPDATSELLEVAETRDRAASALSALVRDPDPAISQRAAQLLATLSAP
jgi:hypothetical protein